jgi:uncharacterized protein YbbK (DUF523 family)/uncharacterized protein YbgA (DUF1722 family)
MFHKPNVFVSACVEFDSCRYDGTKISDDTVKRLMPYVNFIKVCPELAIGYSSPRESFRLIERPDEETKFVVAKTGEDVTKAMSDFSKSYIEKLKKKKIDGFILKAKSPSCGISNVKKYYDIGKAHSKGSRYSGIFGGMVLSEFPSIMVETERRLSNFPIRERFYISIFTLADFRSVKEKQKAKELVIFHTKYKYLFMTYQQLLLKKLGNIVANHEKNAIEQVLNDYEVILKELFKKEPLLKRRINVLTHLYGYFKTKISVSEKEFYFDLIDQYLNHQIPYRNVLNLLYSWSLRFDEEYLINQKIFNPYPKELLVIMDSGKNV